MPGSNLNLDLPSLSDTMATVVSKLVAAVSAIEDDLAPKITAGELNINAALDMGGNALTDCTSVQLAAGNTPSAVGSIFYENGEFFAIDAAGTVQLTLNGAVNVASQGGFTGDYGKPGVNAQAYYDSASTQYRFFSDTAVYADLVARNLFLEGSGGNVEIKNDPSLATSYTVTLPAALPSAARPLFIDDTGALSTTHGCLINRAVFTASGTYTPTAGVKSILVRMVGGGGGGGGAATGTGGAAGGGGGSGEYWEGWFNNVTAGGTVTVGSAGAGGAAGNNSGGNGSETLVTINGTAYGAGPGNGGAGEASESLGSAIGGVSVAAGSSGATLKLRAPGSPGWNARSSADLGFSGAGGSNPLGSGGVSVGGSMASAGSSTAGGNNGTGYGSGGSGGWSANSSAAAAGGNGMPGLVIIDEFA